MRFYIYILLFICFVLFQITTIWAQIDSKKEERIKQLGTILKQNSLVSDLINDDSVPIEQILPEIKKLENLTKDNILWYLEFMKTIVGQLQNRVDDEIAMAKAKEIIAKAVFMSLENENFSSAEKNNALFNQLCIALTLRFRPHKTEILIDSDPKLRQKNVDRLLDLYQLLVTQIEDDYDPYISEEPFSFVPPTSYRGHYDSGQDMSNAEDEETRKAYKKYKEEKEERQNKRLAQRTVFFVRKQQSKDVVQYLIDAYSFFPYRMSELEHILTEKRVDSKMAKEILEAVRKVEKEYPDKGFRIWLSNDKMLKVTAKFISFNNDEITLEKEDGTQMTIELSAFRKEDQDFVKRNIEQEQEPIKDSKKENYETYFDQKE
jgi:hypothetical protein